MPTPSSTRYEWIDLDVWGNARDGFEVNNSWRTGLFIVIPDTATDRDILKALRDARILTRGATTRSVTIDGDDGMLFLEKVKDGSPVGHLYATKDGE